MKHLLKNVEVVDNQSPYHGDVVDMIIENDQITAIGENLADPKAREIDLNGACVSPGWIELHSNFADPGFEERETIASGARAAAAGGFTGVALSPDTKPAVQTKADVEYILAKASATPINIYPIGALSRNILGEELAEMYDMHQAGALGFYDGKKAIKNPNLLKLALLYTSEFAPVFVHPRHPELTQGGQINEGHTSTYLGLKGIPAFAEELMIARDLFIAEYTGGRLHFAGVSTAGAVQLIREAKAKGLAVTADVNFYNLIHTEAALADYDTNYKLNPPLRLHADIEALIGGLKDGTIDAIAADHIPHNIENKRCEFEHAAFGMAAIECLFGALHPTIKALGLPKLVETLSNNPRSILDLPQIRIAEGNIAELTFFDPNAEFTLHTKNVHSIAANNPFLNQSQTGKIIGIFNKAAYIAAH